MPDYEAMDTTTTHHVLNSVKWVAIFFCLSYTPSLEALDADLSVSRFQTPEKSYVELFIYILGNTVTSVSADSAYSASVNVTYFITSEGVVVAGDKYNLISRGKEIVADFMDLRRHVLSPGDYLITLELSDNYDSMNTVTLSKQIVMNPRSNSLAQSDILLLAHVERAESEDVWVRNGWRMAPLAYQWYRADLTNLYFYHELYNSDITPGADFYIQYAILSQQNADKILLQGYKRLKPKSINTVVQVIDISGLSSGEYVLRVGVFDQDRNQHSTVETMFIRTNPAADEAWADQAVRLFETSFTHGLDRDSLRYALKAIAPKVSQIQTPVLNYLLEKGEIENQRRFLHQYWVETGPNAPERAYAEYMHLAAVVDKEYHSAFGYGFETDRGFILLRYGSPDDIIAVDDEPSAPPYEIWFYHDFPVTSQSNVRFLFYNPSLAGGDYRLLHSTAVGEVQNPRWQMELYRDAITEPEGGDFINARDVRSNFHRRAVEYFND